MAEQLVLVESAPEWRIDEDTRRAGREGVAAARQALRASVERAERRRKQAPRHSTAA